MHYCLRTAVTSAPPTPGRRGDVLDRVAALERRSETGATGSRRACNDALVDALTVHQIELGGCLGGRRLYETMLPWETDPSLRDNERSRT